MLLEEIEEKKTRSLGKQTKGSAMSQVWSHMGLGHDAGS